MPSRSVVVSSLYPFEAMMGKVGAATGATSLCDLNRAIIVLGQIASGSTKPGLQMTTENAESGDSFPNDYIVNLLGSHPPGAVAVFRHAAQVAPADAPKRILLAR